jgi:hypothetical protein
MRDEIVRAREILAETDVPRAERPLDALGRWRRDADAFARECERAKREQQASERAQMREATESHTEDWRAYFEQLLANERALILEGAGEAIGRVRAALRTEIRELRAEVEALKAVRQDNS